MVKRCRRGTYKTRWAGDAHKSSTAAPGSCGSRRSPAAACRLATTERGTQKGLIHHADSVDGRCRAGGARFGALSDPHGWRRYCEVLRHSSPCFHALEGFESIGSVAKRGPGCKGTRFCATFCATSTSNATRRTSSERPRTPRNDGVRTRYVSFYVPST